MRKEKMEVFCMHPPFKSLEYLELDQYFKGCVNRSKSDPNDGLHLLVEFLAVKTCVL